MRTALLVILALSVAPLASADPTAQGTRAQPTSDCARARAEGRACSLTFEEDTLEGGVPSATGSQVVVVPPAQRSSLIRVRTSFRREIIRTAESL